MKEFNSLVRDTLPVNNPNGTWQNGKNMLLSKGYKSITNEEGFDFQYLVPGTSLGFISTTKHIVFFSKNANGLDEIGIVNTDSVSPVYTPIIKSNLFNFQLNCPIEGVFIYNYKDELSVAWSDGLKANSNSPKVMNLTNPPLQLNVDKTIVDNNEFTKLNLFPNIKEASIDLTYLDSGAIEGYVAYVTYAYVFDDDSMTPYFAANTIAYLGKGFDPVDKKGMRLVFTGLDANFSKFRIGVVLKVKGVYSGYESYDINYTNGTKTIDITTLSGYTGTSAENIILEKSIFTKIETITKHENQVLLGKVATAEPIQFQKYANLLTLKPYRYISNGEQDAGLMPDEVYAMYVQVQFLDGSYSDAFHLPGIAPEINDPLPLTVQQIADYNLGWTVDLGSENFKQFHFFNNGLVSADTNLDRFGFWQNEETYPNTDDFDSRVDYEGTPLGDNDSDLRSKPIRYHRMPSISRMFAAGETELADSNNLDSKSFVKIGIEVTNFETIIPLEIREKIQGYRLCFIKRNFGNSYVAGNWIMTRRGERDFTQAGLPLTWKFNDFNYNDGNVHTAGSLDVDFTKGRILSNELTKFTPTVDITYIKSNYLIRVDETGHKTLVPPAYLFGRVINNIKYVPANNIEAGTQYLEEGIDMNIDYVDYLNLVYPTYIDLSRYFVNNITAFAHKTNLYSGFKSNNLVVLGKTNDLGNNVKFKGGDIFNEAEIDIAVHTAKILSATSATQFQTRIKIKGLYSPVNASQLYNYKVENEIDYTIGSNTPDDINSEYLNGRDYTFEVKHEEDLSVINDINTILTFDYNNNFVTRFPFRIHRGIKIPNENLSITALRTFLTSDYYEMPNDKGEIIALRGTEQKLFIQLKYALYVAVLKDKLITQNVDAYLGRADLFDRPPQEIISDDKGYIGSSSKFACTVIKGMYITVNQATGKIFTVKEGVKEISAMGNRIWFKNNWDNGLDFYELNNAGEKQRIDNPFISVGHLVGYDKDYERLLFVKKAYKFIGDMTGVTFDGEFYTKAGIKLEYTDTNYFVNLSRTISFDLGGEGKWLFEHDYHPNLLLHTHTGLYSGTVALNGNSATNIYKHNSKLSKGLYYGQKFKSYVDLIFNTQSDISKLYQGIGWITDVINNEGGNEQFKTISHIMIYNSNQCSDVINLKDNHFSLTRNAEGEWRFNDFRDTVINSSNPFIDENGEVIQNNINNVKLWFEKSNFISKFIIVRLIVDNMTNDSVYIHEVKVNSIISNR